MMMEKGELQQKSYRKCYLEGAKNTNLYYKKSFWYSGSMCFLAAKYLSLSGRKKVLNELAKHNNLISLCGGERDSLEVGGRGTRGLFREPLGERFGHGVGLNQGVSSHRRLVGRTRSEGSDKI
jgi:hypothetical protein